MTDLSLGQFPSESEKTTQRLFADELGQLVDKYIKLGMTVKGLAFILEYEAKYVDERAQEIRDQTDARS